MSNDNNILKIVDMFSLANKNKTLMSITIELLTKCNWKCKHCFLPTHCSYGLQKDEIFDIFEQLRELGCFEITFTGGELFFREDAMEIIKKAREMYFDVVLFTNVSLLNENKIKELSELYVSQISCTIFSLDEKIHDTITGIKGSFKRAMENIMLIKKYNIPLEIKTIFMKMNSDSFEDLKLFCFENGFKYKADHSIFRKNDGDCTPQLLSLTEVQLEKLLPKIDDLIGYSPTPRQVEEHVCPSIRNSLFIDHEGVIYPCNRFFIKLGDIYNSSISEIWNNSKELRMLQDVKWGDVKECIECANNKYCVRCPGVALLEDGNMFSKSSLACNIAKTREKLYSNQ